MRIGDADRDRAAADLGEHFASGRLTAVEHAERLDAIWTARSEADLEPIFEDLPALRVAAPRRRPGWHPFPFLPVLFVLVALTVVTHLPFVLLGLVVGGLLFARRRRLTAPRLS